MSERSGVYLRADIDISPEDNPYGEVTHVGEGLEGPGFTFVDLHTHAPRPEGSQRAGIEKLTNAVQDRLHLIPPGDLLLFRWPWLAGPGDESHVEMVERWLARLKEVVPDSSVASADACVGVIQHRVADEPLLRWGNDEPADIQEFLSHARAIELQALLRRSNAIWEPATYHYGLPSGEHTDVFIRLADAIQSPRDAYVIACWLTDRLSDGIGVVVDTGGLTPVLVQIESFMARFDKGIGPTSILQSYPAGRPAVRRTVEWAYKPGAPGFMGIQSVSSSGELLRTFADELKRAADTRGVSYTLDVLVDRRKEDDVCTKFFPCDTDKTASWLGLGEAAGVGSSGSCELCRDPKKAHYVAVDPRTYGEMVLPAPHLVMPDIQYADNGHLFWERVANLEALAIEANPHPRSRVARGKRTALPVRLIFELIADPDGLTELVRERLSKSDEVDEVVESIRHTGLVVASANDLETRARPEFAGGGDVNLEAGLRSVLAGLGLDSSMPVVAHEDHALAERIAELNSQEAVLVFSWGAVTGLTLRQLKLSVADALRDNQMERDVNGLVFHSRPSSPTEWTALQNPFRPGALIDLWMSCYPWDSPLVDERRLLDRSGFESIDLEEPARRFFDLRTRFLRLHDDHMNADDDWSPRFETTDGASHPAYVFWGMSGSGLHQTHVRGRSLYGEGLDCLTAYAAIGAVIHYTRLNEQPNAAPRWVMFDLGRLVRSYFDAIIICSVLRWLRPGELWWGGDKDDPESVRDSVSFLLDQITYETANGDGEMDGVEEQVLLVPELLLACAQGKVPSTAHDFVCKRAREILNSWPDDESFDLARGAVEVGLALLESN